MTATNPPVVRHFFWSPPFSYRKLQCLGHVDSYHSRVNHHFFSENDLTLRDLFITPESEGDTDFKAPSAGDSTSSQKWID